MSHTACSTQNLFSGVSWKCGSKSIISVIALILMNMEGAGSRRAKGTGPLIFTPHAQCERGKVIDRGVHIYIYMSVVKKKI